MSDFPTHEFWGHAGLRCGLPSSTDAAGPGGGAQACQGWGRGFESLRQLHISLLHRAYCGERRTAIRQQWAERNAKPPPQSGKIRGLCSLAVRNYSGRRAPFGMGSIRSAHRALDLGRSVTIPRACQESGTRRGDLPSEPHHANTHSHRSLPEHCYSSVIHAETVHAIVPNCQSRLVGL
jgi:hypothetical protein